MKITYDENGRISEITFTEGDNQEKLLDTFQTIVDKHNAAIVKLTEIQAEQNVKQTEIQAKIQAKQNVASAKMHALAMCGNASMIQAIAIDFGCDDITIEQK